MALEKSNVLGMVTDHAFQTKAEAESAWNTYGSELAADIGYCGVCNRPYEEHAITGATQLREAIAHAAAFPDAPLHDAQKVCDDIIRFQAKELTTPAIQVDEQGHLILTDAEIERVAHRVIEILGREMTKWLSLLQSNFPKA